jgi:adenosylcobinamide kinase/adenosylcobinamide-phosphate guanylyltransferase
MKILFIGGMRSGKSRAAEAKAIELSGGTKPYYLATSEALDDEMRERIARHKAQRADRFESMEEPVNIRDALVNSGDTVLIECLSIWINNMLHYGKDEADIMDELHKILALEKNIVFVINEVGCGVIPDNALVREFVDINGRISQLVAAACDEVYFCSAGLQLRMK